MVGQGGQLLCPVFRGSAHAPSIRCVRTRDEPGPENESDGGAYSHGSPGILPNESVHRRTGAATQLPCLFLEFREALPGSRQGRIEAVTQLGEGFLTILAHG